MLVSFRIARLKTVIFNHDSILALSRWETKNLKYRIKNYPSYLSKNEVEYTIQAAFDIWSEHTDLTFTPIKSGNAHINIGFGQIDGPSGVLAYAYFPVRKTYEFAFFFK